MKVLIVKENDVMIVKLYGRLDAKTAAEFEKKIQCDLVPVKKNVCLDCQELEYISSAGLSALILLAKELKSNDCALVLSNLQPMVSDILHVTGLIDKVFTVQP
ncbi:Putative anti-sigma factor antagonist [Piscirickettsia salmonis]|uniref:STAS domain-containing protein n=1 Tax=Piscirickettsia salmonis TaxID=1238 RepID=UPI000F075A91|nr:STAS domain-containing protein [Piscirickettsia salmonis]QGP50787.1 Putative anti-sigma factor antagonist [Piscirickettsia salmonis]RNC77473.1 anti-sigma factor antagonist [Piscirickettsiaceae bacterium NZ-RLO2]